MGVLDIKKFFENKGFHPERITRVGIGHLSVEKMLPGTWKKLEASSVFALLGQPELAKKQIENIVEKKGSRKQNPDQDRAARADRLKNSTPIADRKPGFVTGSPKALQGTSVGGLKPKRKSRSTFKSKHET